MNYDIIKLRQNMQRRASWHDYRSRAIYMVTLLKSPAIPELAVLTHPSPGCYRSERTPAGKIVEAVLGCIESVYPALRVWKFVVMPDHVHFILYAGERLPRHIGQYVGALKRRCSINWAHLCQTPLTEDVEPFFLPGFHDRILTVGSQLGNLKHYIADNPRRAWLKREHSDLFTKTYRIEAGGEVLEAVGNRFLLEDFDKRAVVAHNRYTVDEMTQHEHLWQSTADNGGVLISPFVHPVERKWRDYAIEGSGRIISIRLNGFGPRFKPEGRLFDLCAEGRLLLLAPLSFTTGKTILTKPLARRFNAVAEAIEAGNWSIHP